MDGLQGSGTDGHDHAPGSNAIAALAALVTKPDPRRAAFTPEIIHMIQLDELCGRMGDLMDMVALFIPKGEVHPRWVEVTDKPVMLRAQGWMATTLVNDAMSNYDVFVLHEMRMVDSTDPPIKPGGAWMCDFRARVGEPLYLVCKSGGTARVRAWGMR